MAVMHPLTTSQREGSQRWTHQTFFETRILHVVLPDTLAMETEKRTQGGMPPTRSDA